jgi:hypothetical protein
MSKRRDMRCRTCAFFDINADCHAGPAHPVTIPGVSGVHYRYPKPPKGESDWCGCWETKTMNQDEADEAAGLLDYDAKVRRRALWGLCVAAGLTVMAVGILAASYYFCGGMSC